MRPFSRRMVKASSSACVGCSCAPSPALITPQLTSAASMSGTPACAWRTTMRSGAIASRFLAVSSSVSPFLSDEEALEKLTQSADIRLAAISKLELVRVEGSKNRPSSVRPRSVGTFLIGRRATSRNESAESRIISISATSRSAMPSRCLRVQTVRFNGVHAPSSTSSTLFSPSSSSKLTFTCCSGVVVTLRPTTSAWIGSSR